MENLEKLAAIKNKILEDAEKADKSLKTRAIIMAFVEGGLLITYLCLMNFHDRLHWLILVAAILTYGTVTAGLMTMMARLDGNTQRILKAVYMGREGDDAFTAK